MKRLLDIFVTGTYKHTLAVGRRLLLITFEVYVIGNVQPKKKPFFFLTRNVEFLASCLPVEEFLYCKSNSSVLLKKEPIRVMQDVLQVTSSA